MKKDMPNLFIVGAPKAGTTFLYEALKGQKELFFPKVKELNHFSFDELKASSYYRDYKLESRKKYLAMFSNADQQKYLVDSSVSYFAYPSVARKVYEFNPNAKIVISLRNPIKRAYSHYQMDQRMGHAGEGFENYIHRDKNDAHYVQYIQNSMYFENITEFLKYFPAEQIHIMLLEEIDKALPSLFDFLGIAYSENEFDTDTKVNENKKPRNLVARFFQKNRKIAIAIKGILPSKLIKSVNNLMYKQAEQTKMNDHCKDFLLERFEADIEALSNYMNVDLKEKWGMV